MALNDDELIALIDEIVQKKKEKGKAKKASARS
jgi:hypothetical protein